MARLLLGALLGMALSVAYVRYELDLPEPFQLVERLRGNVISTATETELYDLEAGPEQRRRALEVYFANRARDAATLDADAGHPFLERLHRARALHEARLLLAERTAIDAVLSKPALRAALERKHGATEDPVLKQAVLFDALDRFPFLKAWLAARPPSVTPASLAERLTTIARQD